jgi:hypothetical protein
MPSSVPACLRCTCTTRRSSCISLLSLKGSSSENGYYVETGPGVALEEASKRGYRHRLILRHRPFLRRARAPSVTQKSRHVTPVGPEPKQRTQRQSVLTIRSATSILTNGELFDAAEADSFDVLITTDQKLRDQQNLSNRRLGILALPATRWPEIERHAADVVAAVAAIRSGDYIQLEW